MRTLSTFILTFICSTVFSQSTIDFENINLAPESFNNDTLIIEQGMSFYNYFDNSMGYDYWEGFALSNQTDTITSSYLNQYSSITASGANNSSNFLVHYQSGGIKLATPQLLNFKITNTTYAALDMRDGSGFSKKFGGATGNDPDYFGIKIVEYLNKTVLDTTVVYLADFRFTDNTQDYIVKEWIDVNLSHNSDSVSFHYFSSDTGSFGINTPQYFCLDNIQIQYFSLTENTQSSFVIYPNPSSDFIHINGAENSQFKITDIQGKLVGMGHSTSSQKTLDIQSLKPGIYILSLSNQNSTSSFKFIKN